MIPMTPLGLGNVGAPGRRGEADEAKAVAIAPTIATVTSVTPVIHRRDRSVWCCGVRFMVRLGDRPADRLLV
jgi:hypothetical protein